MELSKLLRIKEAQRKVTEAREALRAAIAADQCSVAAERADLDFAVVSRTCLMEQLTVRDVRWLQSNEKHAGVLR